MLVISFTKFIRTFTIYSLSLIRLLSARFWASCWGRGVREKQRQGLLGSYSRGADLKLGSHKYRHISSKFVKEESKTPQIWFYSPHIS